MNSEIKTKWVAALRSGKYLQGKHKLRTLHENEPTRYCCIGVLADIIDPIKWREEFLWDSYLVDSFQWQEELPASTQGTLIDMNDMLNKSFEEIADYIENNIPGD